MTNSVKRWNTRTYTGHGYSASPYYINTLLERNGIKHLIVSILRVFGLERLVSEGMVGVGGGLFFGGSGELVLGGSGGLVLGGSGELVLGGSGELVLGGSGGLVLGGSGISLLMLERLF